MKRRRPGEWLIIFSAISSHLTLDCATACSPPATTPIEVEGEEGVTILREAVNCTNAGTIEATWTGPVLVPATIVIRAGTFLEVTGGDDAEAIGSSSTRLFEVESEGGLDITGMALTGGFAAEGGAIMSDSGVVRAESCEVYNNTANSSGGGAIWATGGSLTILGSYFHDNTALDHNGGAIYAINVDLTVREGARFENNSAVEGGAVFCGGSVSGSSSDTRCSFDGAVFVENKASSSDDIDPDDFDSPWEDLWGGGGISLENTSVTLRNCTFELNYAQLSGAGVYAGEHTTTLVEGCTFLNNSTPGFGGGATVFSATFNESTVFKQNEAGRHGAAVFAWDGDGRVEVDSLRCSHNTAGEQGGCLYTAGDTVVQNEVSMENDRGEHGGCIYVATGSNTTILGGNYSCSARQDGAFLYTSGEGTTLVKGGFVTGCLAERTAGVAYCSEGDDDKEGARVTIAGGTFIGNKALELGGALVASATSVTVSGGIFANNTARYYGGFVFLEEQASLVCEGATIRDNYAGDQGGGVYARDAVDVNLSRCDLLDNESPQGAAAYLTHVKFASFRNLSVSGNVPSSGSAVFIAQSVLMADEVTFDARNASALDLTNFAVQTDTYSFFHGHDCAFKDWNGDVIVSHGGYENGSLTLNNCDFRSSSSAMVVISSQSDAEIRNAHVGQQTFENAIDNTALVDNALSCSSPGVCGDEACFNSSLGVLCRCLPPADGDACLEDGPTLLLEQESLNVNVTRYPNNVEFKLSVLADTDGSTDAIWELASSSEKLDLSVVPSSGIVSPGEKTTIAVTGIPVDVNTGGNVTSTFVLTTVMAGSDGSDDTADHTVEVTSVVYLCDEYEVAVPGNGTLVECEQCSGLEGEEGVNCEDPGATLELLPIRTGYWRSDNQSRTILLCDFSKACAGGPQATTADDYCAPGFVGPYCAVCDENYGMGVGNRCHPCTGTTATLLIMLGSIFCLLAMTFILVTVVFLIGGLDAIDLMRDSIVSSLLLRASGTSRGRSTTAAGGLGSSIRRAEVRFAPNIVPVCEVGRATGDEIAEGNISDYGDEDEDAILGESQQHQPRQQQQQLADEAADSGAAHVSSMKGRSLMNSEKSGSFKTPRGSRIHLFHRANAFHLRKGETMSRRNMNPEVRHEAVDEERSGCCGLGGLIKRWASRLPLDKLKILVVVWQILTVFASVASVDFPPVYSTFLSWIDVVNLNLGQIFSASCLFPNVTHYERLLAVTLIPLLLGLVLVITYQMALRRAGIGTAGIIARRAAWSRHMAAGLLLTFLVFTSASTTIFRTFSCDPDAIPGESFLRADYSVKCNTPEHTKYRIYAGFMILVYPIGIPLVYFLILWTNRESLNPTIRSPHPIEPQDDFQINQDDHRAIADDRDGPETLEEKIRQRTMNPDLVPSMFLWKDFGPDLYYYEVIECGRRILLTSVLIFIAPQSPTQATMACIFAFGTLLGFELLRPHLDPADVWLYRLGCVVIFLSNFLTLLIKSEAVTSDEKDTLDVLIVFVNLILVLAVIVTSWFSTQQSVDDSRAEDNPLAVAKSMITAERLAANSLHARRTNIIVAGGNPHLGREDRGYHD